MQLSRGWYAFRGWGQGTRNRTAQPYTASRSASPASRRASASLTERTVRPSTSAGTPDGRAPALGSAGGPGTPDALLVEGPGVRPGIASGVGCCSSMARATARTTMSPPATTTRLRSMCGMVAHPKMNRDYARQAYWHATMPPLPDRSGRDLPDVVDVAVVGGGYTGVAAARKLALQGAKVVVLEAETLGWGASTRNGGIAHPGFKWGPISLAKRYGPQLGRALYQESRDATDFVAGLVRDQGIDAELRWNGFLELAWAKAHADDFEAEAAALTDFGTPSRAIAKARLHDEIGTDAYHGGLAVDGGGILHPAKWFVGLVGLAERAGAELHEGIRVRG